MIKIFLVVNNRTNNQYSVVADSFDSVVEYLQMPLGELEILSEADALAVCTGVVPNPINNLTDSTIDDLC